MGISTLYNIGVTGVRAQRTAIDITGQNIANVNTDGYSKQRVILSEEIAGSSLGSGVNVTAVQRSYDRLLQRQLVDGDTALSQSQVEESALKRIEPLFNEIGSDGLGKAISDFFNSWQDLSLNPTGDAERQNVYLRGQILTDNFHQVDSGLSATATIANDSLTEITGQVSDYAANIAKLNEMIVSAEQLGTGSSNTLKDQRDLYVQQLAQKVGINYYENRDGSVDIKLAGFDLVIANKYAEVYNSPKNSAQPGSIYISPLGNPPRSSGGVSPDMLLYSQTGAALGTNSLSYQGELGGTLHVRDVIVPEIKTKLDGIASEIVTQMNTAHSAGFYFDTLGNQQSGGNFFDPLQTTAAGITMESALNPDTIAAGSQWSNPPTNSIAASVLPGNNSNAKYIAGLQQSIVGNSYTSLVSEIGVKVSNAENLATTKESFLRQITNLRESTSGVSLDEELTNLVKYQRAFEGSAKLITTANEMMDTILGLIR